MQKKQDMLMFNVIIINTEVVNITMNLIIKNDPSVFLCVRISRKKQLQQQPTGKITRF